MANVLGVVVLTPGTSATPGAQSLTVPSGALGVLVFSTLWANGAHQLNTLTSNFAGTFTLNRIASSGSPNFYSHAGVATALVTSTGSKTLTPTWTTSPAEGPLLMVVFIDDIDTGDWLNDVALDQETGSNNPAGTVSSNSTDLVLAFIQKFNAIPAAPSGTTSVQTAGVTNSEGGRLVSVNSPGSTNTTVTATGSDFSCIAVISLKASSLQSYSYSATGGLSLGGSATVVAKRAVEASGGIVLSGAAGYSSSALQSYSYSATGGIQLGGASEALRAAVWDAAGGLVFAGQVSLDTHESTRTVAADGGLTLGGAASMSYVIGGGDLTRLVRNARRRGRVILRYGR